MPQTIELIRSTKDEKRSQLTRLGEFHARHNDAAPAMLKKLQQAAIANANAFEVLMDAARVCSLGQITNALFEVGGQYRRSMQVDLETSCCQSGLGRQRGPSFFALRAKTRVPAEFLVKRALNQTAAWRDPFDVAVAPAKARERKSA